MFCKRVYLAVTILGVITRITPCIHQIDVLGSIFSCLEHLTNGSDSYSLLAGSDVQYIHDQCTSGGFNRSVACLENFYRSCKTEKMKIFKKIADPSSWRRGFDQFCTNFPDALISVSFTFVVYKRESVCLQEQDPQIQRCISDNTKDIQNKNDVTIVALCKYFLGLHDCSTRPVQVNCGKGIAGAISDVTLSITPPICFVHHNGLDPLLFHPGIVIGLCLFWISWNSQ